MENKYAETINKVLDYNEYREDDNNKHLDNLLEDLKRHIAECKTGRYDVAVGFCRQFLHDIEFYEQQNAICGEVRKTLMDIKINCEELEEKQNE